MKTVSDVLENIPDDAPNHEKINHTQSVRERITNTEPGEALYDSYNQNQKLERDSLSPTIINESWKYAHYDENRALTVRERAAIQSFPHNYVFTGSRCSQRLQVANAVPPKLAESVADDYL